jgi:hypothetical protein
LTARMVGRTITKRYEPIRSRRGRIFLKSRDKKRYWRKKVSGESIKDEDTTELSLIIVSSAVSFKTALPFLSLAKLIF